MQRHTAKDLQLCAYAFVYVDINVVFKEHKHINSTDNDQK